MLQGETKTSMVTEVKVSFLLVLNVYTNLNIIFKKSSDRIVDTSPENDPEGYAPSGIKARASDKFYSSSYQNHRGDNGVSGKDSSMVNTP